MTMKLFISSPKQSELSITKNKQQPIVTIPERYFTDHFTIQITHEKMSNYSRSETSPLIAYRLIDKSIPLTHNRKKTLNTDPIYRYKQMFEQD